MMKTTAANDLMYSPSLPRKCSVPFAHCNCTLKS